uniref:Putative salivary lipocalin n=1 Tax=Ixodes ricinus TaxID=34613 RepID=A0A0K8R7L3_IXORI
MYLTHLVFASLVAAAIATDGTNSTMKIETHTDAWKTVSQNETFYLMYRSYEYDAGTGGTGKCVSVKLCDKNDTTRTATSRLMYRDAQTTQLMGFTARVTMARSWNSSVDDIIRLGNADDCTAPANAATAEYRLVYSDYSSCDVMVVFGTLEPRCELWVKDGYQKHLQGNTQTNSREEGSQTGNQNITECVNQYENLCKVKYQIYDKNICSSPMGKAPKAD